MELVSYFSFCLNVLQFSYISFETNYCILYWYFMCYFIYSSSNLTSKEKVKVFAEHYWIGKPCEQVAKNVRALGLQEYPFKNTKINVQCAQLGVRVNTQGLSKHFIANVDGTGTEIRGRQKSMDPINLVGKFLFIFTDLRCVLVFHKKTKKKAPVINILFLFFWYICKDLNYSRCCEILI